MKQSKEYAGIRRAAIKWFLFHICDLDVNMKVMRFSHDEPDLHFPHRAWSEVEVAAMMQHSTRVKPYANMKEKTLRIKLKKHHADLFAKARSDPTYTLTSIENDEVEVDI